MTKKNIIVSAVAVLVILGGVYFAFTKSKAKPVTTNVDNTPVATVNGVAITKTAYDNQLASLTASLQGQGVNTADPVKAVEIKKQALDNLIGNELVAEGIKASGLSATSAEVQIQLDAIIKQNGGQAGLDTALTTAGITEDKLKENIASQITTQKYLTANVKLDGLTATDAEVSAFYDQYKQANGTTTPPLKTVSALIKQQIISNKQQTLINDFVTALRTKATIVVNMTF